LKKKLAIKRLLVLAAWLLVIGGITSLLVAANKKQTEHVCKNVNVSIKGSGEKYYIDKTDILKQLEGVYHASLLNKPLKSISLVTLEKSLEKDQWIKDAELYFDREDALHVIIEERTPIARVFTTGGRTFYIDSSGHQMPVLDKTGVRVPVITGFINSKKFNSKDSALLADVKKIAWFVYSNEFWNAQVGQVDITSERKFELIPVIGDHIIRLGNADSLENKMSRVLLFYRRVLSKVGFNKYSAVDVEFDGQVVGVNKGPVSKIDSIQLQKNIRELLEKSTIQNVSEEMLPEARALSPKDSMKTFPKVDASIEPLTTNPIPSKNSDPEKLVVLAENKTLASTHRNEISIPVKPKKEQQTHQRPKAVMKRKV
jgi:cell division protein FtsQ